MVATINSNYNLPQGFYDYIKPYLHHDLTADYSAAGLIRLWQSALAYRKQYPDLQESIAEWTMSVGSGSSLTMDNDLFEAIHNMFGSLEVTNDSAETVWQQLETMVAEAALTEGKLRTSEKSSL